MSKGKKTRSSSSSVLVMILFSMVSLKVGNLTWRTNNRDLEELFGKYGKVKELHVD